jgi:RHS repeat-associated protein
MKVTNKVKWFSGVIATLWVATGMCIAQSDTPATSGGPVSASDQQVQAIDQIGNQEQQKVDLFTGSFGYSIPIKCAPARNGSEPKLALGYSSGGDNGWCGMGWDLNIGYIERNTRDGFPIAYSSATPPTPLTQYNDSKGFMLNLGGRESKLFAVATNSTGFEYRAEVDTEFLRCLLDTNNNNWTVYDKSGNAFYFGESSSSRVANPKSGWSGYGGTFHWGLDQIVTANGDWTTVSYATYTSPNTGIPARTIYPTQITYNGHTNLITGYSASAGGQNTITFQTEIRTNDWRFSYRWGFRTEQCRRLTNILCSVGSQNVWSYNLKYAVSAATSRSLLANVIFYGYDVNNNPSSLLTNTFAYQGNPNAVSFGPPILWSNVVLNAPGSTSGSYDSEISQVNASSGFSYSVADLIDIDGDGLPDRIAYDTNSPNGYQVQKNLGMQANGSGSFGSRYYFGPTSTGSGQVATNTNPFPDGSGYAQLNTPYGRIRDINGDGLPDRVEDYWWALNSVPSGQPPYVPYTNYEVQINTGQGFSSVANWPVSTGPLGATNVNSTYYYCVESGGVNVGFFDINGDGLPDRVMSGWYQQGPMTNFMVQLNTGTNFTQPMVFGPYHSQNYNQTSQSQQYTWAGIETTESHMIDINGDGLPDRLMFPMNPSSAGNELHPTTYYAVEYNDGYGFDSTNSSTSISGACDQWPGGSGLETANGGSPADSIINLPYVGLFDVNGDGLPDRVMLNWNANTNSGTSSTSWLVYLNNGHGFNSSPIVVSNIFNQGQNTVGITPNWWSMEGEVSGAGVVNALIDINGDGLLDRVMAVYDNGYNNANSTSNYFMVQLNQGPFPDLLVSVNNGIGGNLAVAYNSSVAYDNRVDTTNPNSVSRMPFPRQVVATVTESDGINSAQTTTYGYGGGYYDGPRREFHGFAVVTNTDATLRYTVTYFHTGGGRNYSSLGEYQDTNSTTGAGNFAKAGMAYRVETYGNDNALYHVKVNQVDQTSLGLGRYFPFVTLSADYDYPGPKVTAIDYAYDLSNGNLINKIEYGQVNSFSPSTFSFSDAVGSDTRVHNTHYTTIGTYILDHPDKSTLTDTNNNIIRETDYSYNAGGGLAAESTRISAGYFATTGYGYNSYGLVTMSTNPVGVVTKILYESTYNTYPATTEIRANPGTDSATNDFITTTTYDPRSGALTSSKDPAGVTTTNSYDSFCRTVETDIIPAGSTTLVWQKKFSYPASLKPITSATAVNYVDVVANDGLSGGVETRTYVDGLGRPIQSISQGEASNFRMEITAYDPRGVAFLTTWPTFVTSVSYSKPATTFSASWTGFDALGRVATNQPVTATFASGTFSSASALAGDTGSLLEPKTWSYANGTDPWWIIYTDEDGKTRRYGLDAFGRTNQIVEVDGTSTHTTTLNYDLADNLTNLVNANSENVYWAYNDAGGMVAMADPYLGQWTYQLDYAGRVRIQTDGRGDVIQLSYVNPATGFQDPLGRMQTKLVYATNYTSHALTLFSTVTNFYDVSDDNNNFPVFKGLLYKTVDSQGWEKHGYDSRARATATARHLNFNNQTYTKSYGFDDGNNVTSIAYPNAGPTITYSYWHGGSINLVSRSGGSAYYTVAASGYDEFGHVTNFLYGNNLTTTRSYYSVSKRLQKISCGSVFTRSFTYTPGDDIASLSGTGLANTMSVTYDNMHRVKTYGPGLSGSYGYDAVGNITNSIEGGGSTYTYANPRKQAVRTAFGYTNLYDLCGNMMVRHGGLTNSQALTYDPENRLTAIAQAGVMSDEFGYASDGARLWKRINQNPTNTQVWIGNTYEEKGGKVLYHVFAGGEQLCTFETNSLLFGGSDTSRVAYYYHHDNLNSSSVLSSGGSSGSQVEVDSYYPFGRVETNSPQASFQVSRRFTGQVFDAESGLYYYNFRYYDPELGRFIQPDDRLPDMSNPQSYNRYSYVMNDPLTYNDPTGHGVGSVAADAMFNTETLKSSYQLMTMHDTFANKMWEVPTATVGMAAGTADAAFNVLTLGGKGLVEGGLKEGVKAGVKELSKEGAEKATTKIVAETTQAGEKEGVDLTLKYKAGWTDAQKAAADAKAAKLSEADTVVTKDIERSGTTQARYRKEAGLDSNTHADHTVDLQLGGKDTMNNMSGLDKSVNTSLGSQIKAQVKDLPAGTKVNNVKMADQ